MYRKLARITLNLYKLFRKVIYYFLLYTTCLTIYGVGSLALLSPFRITKQKHSGIITRRIFRLRAKTRNDPKFQ